MRNEVKEFAEEMERVLKENDFKGGWSECEIHVLYDYLKREMVCLKRCNELTIIESLDNYGTHKNRMVGLKRKLINVANYCMMVHGKIKDKIWEQ